jgi:predicted phosphodiesterase
LTLLCVIVIIVIVAGINDNDYDNENKNSDYENSDYENSDYENSDYENKIYEEMIKIMLKHNAQYSKFNKQNEIEEIYKSEKNCKQVASSPIPIPKQNVK